MLPRIPGAAGGGGPCGDFGCCGCRRCSSRCCRAASVVFAVRGAAFTGDVFVALAGGVMVAGLALAGISLAAGLSELDAAALFD